MDYCVSGNQRDLPTSYSSVGEKSFGFMPETYTEDVIFDLSDGFLEHNENVEGDERINISENTELELVRVDSCQENSLEEGQLGVYIEEWQD
mgnify:CR=1 FL=1